MPMQHLIERNQLTQTTQLIANRYQLPPRTIHQLINITATKLTWTQFTNPHNLHGTINKIIQAAGYEELPKRPANPTTRCHYCNRIVNTQNTTLVTHGSNKTTTPCPGSNTCIFEHTIHKLITHGILIPIPNNPRARQMLQEKIEQADRQCEEYKRRLFQKHPEESPDSPEVVEFEDGQIGLHIPEGIYA